MIEICRYAYTNEVHLTTENMLTVLSAASKFEIGFLIQKTTAYVYSQISEKTVFKILDMTHGNNNEQIRKKCFEFIEKNSQKCLVSADFLHTSVKNLLKVLGNSKIPQETLTSAAVSWTKMNDYDDLLGLIELISLNNGSLECSSSAINNEQRRFKSHSNMPKFLATFFKLSRPKN